MNREKKYEITFFIHILFFIYCIIGGIITNNKWLLIIFFMVWPITYIHWLFNRGQCFLTEVENEYALGTKYEEINKKYPLFTQRLSLLFGIKTRKEDIKTSWNISLFHRNFTAGC